MPHFTNAPPTDDHRHALPIRRTPTNGRLEAVITSEDLIGCDTHYYGGRTIPCERPDCEPCNKGVPFRWHAYVSAMDARTRLHFIFEVTAQAAEILIEYRNAHGTLRGCLFEAQRLHHRPNGRVLLRAKPAAIEQMRLHQPADLIRCLCTIWSLGKNLEDTQNDLTGPRRAPPNRAGHLGPVNRTRVPLATDANSQNPDPEFPRVQPDR